ncbi:MAG: tyrosine-protein phosphatase [Verrucomicrobiota bacterium]
MKNSSHNRFHRRHTVVPACLLAGLFFAACKPSEDGVQDVEDRLDRRVELVGEPNFRDLGGYRTADGRTVKTGIVYRSGKLSKLTDEDVGKVGELGVRTVISFLAPNEVEHDGADRVPDGVMEVSLPIDPRAGLEGILEELIHARKSGDFSKIPVEVNPEIHRVLVSEAREAYAGLFRKIIEDEKRPIVFHCSHGVHRTGTAAAILLSALGVPWETVREDYLLSNEYRKEEVLKRVEQLRDLAAEAEGVEPEEVDTTNIEAFYVLEGGYIDASLDEILKEYGTMDDYLRKGLGLSGKEIEALRAALLD